MDPNRTKRTKITAIKIRNTKINRTKKTERAKKKYIYILLVHQQQ